MIRAAFLICLAVSHGLTLANAAAAQSIDAARSAYREGRFVETSEGYALAIGTLAEPDV